MNNIVILSLTLGINLLSLVHAANPLPSALISAQWLSEHRDDVRILDLRKLSGIDAGAGHIENAILVEVDEVRVQREIEGLMLTRMRPDAKDFQAFMRKQGINNDSVVVLTHQGKTSGQVAGAARLYWQMKYYGFDNVALLDGGNAAWVAALEELVNEISPVIPGDYLVGQERPEILANMQQVQAALGSPSITLIDTRDFRAHIGVEVKDYVFAAGHIPGSRNLPYKFLHPARGIAHYFSTEKINSILQALRIDTGNDLILYCNSAYECSSVWFVLHEMLGHQRVRIYDGSLHQWTQYRDNPMTTLITN